MFLSLISLLLSFSLCSAGQQAQLPPVPGTVLDTVTAISKDPLAAAFMNPTTITESAIPAPHLSWDDWKSQKPSVPINEGLYHVAAFEIVQGQLKPTNILLPGTWDAFHTLFAHNNTIFGKQIARTYIGQAAFAHLITNPLSTAEAIKERQQILQGITDNGAVRRELSAAMKDIRQAEPHIYRWHYYFRNNLSQAGWSNSVVLNETAFRLWQAASIAAPVFLAKLAYDYSGQHYYARDRWGYLERRAHSGDYASATFLSLLLPLYAFYHMGEYREEQQFLMSLSKLVLSAESVAQVLKKSSQLRTGIPGASTIVEFFEKQGKVADLVTLLKTNTFTGSASYFSLVGRIAVARNLYHECAGEVKDLMAGIGMVDAFVSMAGLVSNQIEDRPMCFVDIVEQTTPSMSVTNAWLPSAAVETPYHYTLSLNKPAQHVAISGPARSGKSTAFTTIATCILMAQTFGIAPAEKMTLTPFASMKGAGMVSPSKLVETNREAWAQAASKHLLLIDSTKDFWPETAIAYLGQLLTRHPNTMVLMTSDSPTGLTSPAFTSYVMSMPMERDGLPGLSYELKPVK